MTTGSLKRGDIIEVNKKGRHFLASVREVGRIVRFIPIEAAKVSYRECTAREIIGIWHANKATASRYA